MYVRHRNVSQISNEKHAAAAMSYGLNSGVDLGEVEMVIATMSIYHPLSGADAHRLVLLPSLCGWAWALRPWSSVVHDIE